MVGHIRYMVGHIRYMVGHIRYMVGHIRYVVGNIRYMVRHISENYCIQLAVSRTVKTTVYTEVSVSCPCIVSVLTTVKCIKI